MKHLQSVRRMAMKVLKCGGNKIWFNPNEYEKIKSVDSIQKTRDLINDGFIVQKLDKVNSRAKARKRAEAKLKGRHMGLGSRKGTANARMPEKTIWMKTLRKMRSTLLEMKTEGLITPTQFHTYRLLAKGNHFRRNNKLLVSYVERKNAEALRAIELKTQAEALKLSEKNN